MKIKNSLKLALIVLSGFPLVSTEIHVVTQTKLGTIRGSILETEKGSEFMSFRGIRYAQPPTGEKRFKAPAPIESWSGELDATRDGFMCPQVGKPIELISEDCLVLNVYTKNLTAQKSVLVFLPGGANIYGGSHSVETAGPEYLMESDIVFVTVSSRLGALGYLSTRTKEAPGNFGYLDQVMALQWIHDHISSFGGNPDSVTILGMSSGSLAVTLHLASPLSRGLFHRAVVMSGSAVDDFAFDNLHWTRQLARDTSCPMYSDINIVDCLRKVPWQRLVEVTESWMFYNLTDMKWSYEVDGHFLTKPPLVAFAEGNFNRVPILTGITKDEYTYMVHRLENETGLLNDISSNFDEYASIFFMRNFENSTTDRVRNFYFGNEAIDLKNFGRIFSDSFTNHPVHRVVQLARHYVDVFHYRFDFMGRYGVFENWNGEPLGVSHGDDLQYIIKRKYLRDTIKRQDPEWFMVERMVKVFSTFAQRGIDGVQWLPCNATQVNTMFIGRTVKLGSEPLKARLQFWDDLFPVRGVNFGIDYRKIKSLQKVGLCYQRVFDRTDFSRLLTVDRFQICGNDLYEVY